MKDFDKTSSKKTNGKRIAFSVVVGIVVTITLYYLVSPLFISTEVNEPLPSNAVLPLYQKFNEMTEDERVQTANKMNNYEKNQMLTQYAKVGNTSIINENVDNGNTTVQAYQTSRSGSFVGVGDGIHNAEGIAKIIPLNYNSNILRLEKLMATNGPDLHVYLSTDRDASDFVNLGRLKTNNGNQNYGIPSGIDLSKYDTVLIWCKAFSVLFGSAELKV